jgi:hypothetical protein
MEVDARNLAGNACESPEEESVILDRRERRHTQQPDRALD